MYLIIKGIDIQTGVAEISDQISGDTIDDIIIRLQLIADRLVLKSQGLFIENAVITNKVENINTKTEFNKNSYQFINKYDNVLSFLSDNERKLNYNLTSQEIQFLFNPNDYTEAKTLDGKKVNIPVIIEEVSLIGTFNNWDLNNKRFELIKLNNTIWGEFVLKQFIPKEGQYKILINRKYLIEPNNKFTYIGSDDKGNFNFIYKY